MKLTADIEGRALVVYQDGGFSPDAKKILRQVAQGAKWNGAKQTWSYPLARGVVAALTEAAEVLGADLTTSPALEAAAGDTKKRIEHERTIRAQIQFYMDDPSRELPAHTTVQSPAPWRHQALATQWAIRVPSLYLAHKPGLGKTRTGADIIRARMEAGWVRPPRQFYVDEHQSVAGHDLIKHYDERGRVRRVKVPKRIPEHWAIRGGVLVVCPKVVLGTWMEELWKWQGIQGLIVWHRTRRTKMMRAGTQAWAHICTYDSLDAVEDNEYDGIIADEMHFLASEDTIRFARMMHLRRRIEERGPNGQVFVREPWLVSLSGTPMSNMLPSLWSQYYWLDEGISLGTSFDQFKNRYMQGTDRNLEAREDAVANVAKQVSRITYFLSMTEAFPEKEGKIQQVYRIPMTAEQVRYYEQVRSNFEAEIQTGHVSATTINVRLLRLLQICQGFVKSDDGKIHHFTSAKLDALRGMLVGGDLSDRRVIVWCRFRDDLDRVVKLLQENGVLALWLHGDVKDRDAIKDAWNTDHRWRVMVGMIQLGIGLNLHAPKCVDEYGHPARCSTTIFYGYDWRVTQLEQAMDRTYRGDQVETCLYRYLISDDVDGYYDEHGDTLQPIDWRVYEVLQAKLGAATELSEESLEYVRSLLRAT